MPVIWGQEGREAMRARVEKKSAFCPLLKATQMQGGGGKENAYLKLMNVLECESMQFSVRQALMKENLFDDSGLFNGQLEMGCWF